MWNFRPARPNDADAACIVLRRSIEYLCSTDHGGDPAILGPWLANKTPEHVTAWINANPAGFIVGVGPDGIVGVGSVVASGEIRLNYVAPWARFRGVSKGLLRAMEDHAASLGATVCTLTSTITAHDFYRRCGYVDIGPPVQSFAGTEAFPIRRAISYTGFYPAEYAVYVFVPF
jgi:GNAT superfamily N-acetyltransferase